MKKFLLSALLLLPALSLFADLSGTYYVKGYAPPCASPYCGTAHIERTSDAANDTYMVHWILKDGTLAVGTGILVGDHFSVVYKELNGCEKHIHQYLVNKIDGKYELEGPWVEAGASCVGCEKLCEITD